MATTARGALCVACDDGSALDCTGPASKPVQESSGPRGGREWHVGHYRSLSDGRLVSLPAGAGNKCRAPQAIRISLPSSRYC